LYNVARRTLPAYTHRCSPKKVTQHQLFACLVLKEFFKLDYRGVEALLDESDSLRAAIDLRQTPDFTTLQRGVAACCDDPCAIACSTRRFTWPARPDWCFRR